MVERTKESRKINYLEENILDLLFPVSMNDIELITDLLDLIDGDLLLRFREVLAYARDTEDDESEYDEEATELICDIKWPIIEILTAMKDRLLEKLEGMTNAGRN